MDLVVAITTLLGIAAVSLLLDWWFSAWLPSGRLPPGPRPWPFLGSIPQVRSAGADLMTAAANLEKKYGKMITLWIGKRPVIIVNDPDLVHDALITQGAFFAERCRLSSSSSTSKGFQSLNARGSAQAAPFRRNMMLNVLNPPSLKAYQANRTETIEDIVRTIRSATEAHGGVAEVNVLASVRSTFMKHTLAMCFGMNVDEDTQQRVTHLLMERIRLNFIFYLGDYIPLFKLFEAGPRGELEANQKECQKLFVPIIQKLRGMQGQDNIIRGNYVATLFQLQDKVDCEMDDDMIATLCCELMNAATHTVSGSMDSAINLLCDHPEIQKRLFDDIQATVGNRPVEESDLPNLPYVLAVVKEALRLRPPAPVCPSHATSELRKLGGYDIPTNAVIYFGIKAVHYDPSQYPDPLAFKPERFLETDPEFCRARDASFLPFSTGRRICPATNLAYLELSMGVARLVQTFAWQRGSAVETEGNEDSSSKPTYVVEEVWSKRRTLGGPLLARVR